MLKNVIKTIIFLSIVFLFVVINTKLDLSEPLDMYEEFILIDESDQYDLIRLADIDDEIVSYGFYSQNDFVIAVENDGEIIKTVNYISGYPVLIDVDIEDKSLIKFNISSSSTSDIIEVYHIDNFDTYLERLFATNNFNDFMDESLYHEETVFLDLLDGSIQAQLIALFLFIFSYTFFMVPFDKLLKKIKLPRIKKWASRIFLHLVATFILYGLIIFVLVTFWGEEEQYDYETVVLNELNEENYNLMTSLSLVKVNGISKNALQVVYHFDLNEKKYNDLVGQLFCGENHIDRIYGYKDSVELEHIYQDVFPAEDCQSEEVLSIDIINNKTGLLNSSYSDIPLYLEVNEVIEIYNLDDSNLGTYFSIGVILLCGLVLVPIGEVLIIKQEKKKKSDVSNT